MIQGTSSYETNSGTLPAGFTYLQVPQDKVFTLERFILEFKNYKNLVPIFDQAKYIRCTYPIVSIKNTPD
jgi:hypothetical protein